MNIKLDIIMSVIILILIIIYKIYQYKRYDLVYRSNFYYLNNKLCKRLIILSIIVLGMYYIYLYLFSSFNITNVMSGIGFMLILLPININNLYRMIFKNEEKYSHIKTIITKEIPDKDIVKKFILSKINVIIFNSNKPSYKIKEISYDDLSKDSIDKSFYINSDDVKMVTKYLNKEEYIVTNDLDKLYNNIMYSRGIHDNYMRCLKYILIFYSCLFLSNLVFLITGFPLIINISIILLFKLLTLLVVEFIISKISFDSDIKKRNVKGTNILFGKQELLIVIIQSLLILFGSSIIYMYLLANMGDVASCRSIYFNILIFSMLFINYYYYSESLIVINIGTSFKSKRMIIYLVLSIVLVLCFNFIKYLYVNYDGYINILSSFLVALIFGCFSDIIKITRWLSNRKRVK